MLPELHSDFSTLSELSIEKNISSLINNQMNTLTVADLVAFKVFSKTKRKTKTWNNQSLCPTAAPPPVESIRQLLLYKENMGGGKQNSWQMLLLLLRNNSSQPGRFSARQLSHPPTVEMGKSFGTSSHPLNLLLLLLRRRVQAGRRPLHSDGMCFYESLASSSRAVRGILESRWESRSSRPDWTLFGYYKKSSVLYTLYI